MCCGGRRPDNNFKFKDYLIASIVVILLAIIISLIKP